MQLLERHAEARLVLLHAPAGYGKSTLMAQWAQRLGAGGRSVGWVWLDDDDNDAGRLGRVLSQALAPEGAGRLDLFDAINGCLAVHSRFTLFLDEAERLEADEALRLIEVLLDFSPPPLHLVIGTRTLPHRWALRLRLRHDCLGITLRDLAMRSDEIVQFMQTSCAVTLDGQSTGTLERATEGWAAALQMAAVEIAQGVSPQQVCARLSAPQSDVLHYLSDEMLVHLQPQQREFLVRTSFLQELYGPLCDAVTGRQDGERQLHELQRTNMLLQPIDASRRHYRYHALLAQLLRQQLHEQHAGELPQLARRAAQWCTREQLHQSAVEYALLSGDPDLLIACIERCIETLIAEAQFTTARRWLRAIAPAVLQRHTDLMIWSAWVDLWTNDFGAAQTALARIGQLAMDLPVSVRQGLMRSILDVLLAILHERFPQALSVLQLARGQMPSSQRDTAVRLDNLSALLAQTQGRFGDAARHAEQALALATLSPPIWLSAVHAAHISAMTEVSLGNLAGALRQLQLPERLLAGADAALAVNVSPNQLMAALCGTKALVLYELNRLDDAEDCLDRHGPFLGAVFSPSSRALWYQLRARLAALRGDEDGCLTILSEGNAYAIRNGLAWMQQLLQWERIDHDLGRGDIDHARSLAAGLLDPLALASAPEWIPTCKEIFGPSFAAPRLLIRTHESHQALAHLSLQIAHAGQQLRRLRETRLRVLEALALHALGERAGAVDALRRALALARHSGAIRAFVDEGSECRALLRELVQAAHAEPDDPSVVFAAALLAAFDGAEGGADSDAGPDSEAPAAGVRVDAAADGTVLSAREAQILQRLSQGYSNLAVGQQLFLSPNTVKWHLRQMYAKLGVRNRTQAVHVARQRNLMQMP
ncbi:MAG TPA: LuxR C-terminal-related transcriptional regulator [Steroidobacteraceae bacterium]|nr:LuxR C-terminal-related transcriptional regulator [Steroidobacteraceae bacterium]